MIKQRKRKNIILTFALTAAIGTAGITGYVKNKDVINNATKKLTYQVARLELDSGQNNKETSPDGQLSGNKPPDKNMTVASMLSDGSGEFDESVTVSSKPLWGIDMAPEEVETPADGKAEYQPSIKSGDNKNPKPYPEKIDNNSGKITEVTFGKCTTGQYVNLEKGGQVRNCTSIDNGLLIAESRLKPEFKITKDKTPQVLIMHTHTTESFEPYTRDYFDSSFNSRTTDTKMNVCAVGDEIVKKLEKAGIGSIHDTTVHDYPDYNGSYQRSCETVQNILKKYPSIKVVLDIHRDAISVSSTERKAPVTTINGKKAAQVMIISGCDNGKMNMPNYMKNFRFACALQQTMESDYPTLTRPVLFDYRNYNQQLTTGSLLIEIGSHANSIDEVKYSGELVGDSLVKTLEQLT